VREGEAGDLVKSRLDPTTTGGGEDIQKVESARPGKIRCPRGKGTKRELQILENNGRGDTSREAAREKNEVERRKKSTRKRTMHDR